MKKLHWYTIRWQTAAALGVLFLGAWYWVFGRYPHYWYFANLEDPNDRGYDAIRRLFLNEMVKVLAPQ